MNATRILRAVGTLLALELSSWSRPVTGQSVDSAAKLLDKRLISPVVATLKRRSQQVGYPVHYLDQVRVRVDYKTRPAYNAWASDRDGTPAIDIDLMFILEDVAPFGQFGASTLIFSNKDDNKLLERVALDYMQKAVAARDAGEPLPRFRFRPEAYSVAPEWTNVMHEAGRDVVSHMVTFFLLHELGHVELGHLSKDAPPTSDLRKAAEVAADDWAFRAMHKLDYSLPLLRAGFMGKGFIETSQQAVIPETISPDYPLWKERAEELGRFMDANPPRSTIATELKGYAYVSGGDRKGAYSAQLLLKNPRGRDLGAAALITTIYREGAAPVPPTLVSGVAEHHGDSTSVRFRMGEALMWIDFKQRLGHEPHSVWTILSVAREPEGSFPMQFYHSGVGSSFQVDSPYGLVGDVAEFDLGQFYDRFLFQRSAPTRVRDTVRALIDRFEENELVMGMAYAMGLRGPDQVQTFLTSSLTNFHYGLKQALGEKALQESKTELAAIAGGEFAKLYFPPELGAGP